MKETTSIFQQNGELIDDLNNGLGDGIDLDDGMDSDDELIDMLEYNKDNRDLILTQEIVDDIINNKSKYNIQRKYLADAFKYLRNNKLSEFRKVVGENSSIINDKYDKTFLIHEACKIGNHEFVLILLFLGAVCDTLDDHGMTAQHHAVAISLKNSTNPSLIIDILFLFGNSMNVKDVDGMTPLQYAILEENEEIINALVIYMYVDEQANLID